MVLFWGVDIPLLEVIFIFGIIIFLLLIESIIVISLLIKQLNKSKKLAGLLQDLSNTLLDIKQKEIEELDQIKK